jgi:hypothetical protein
VQRSPLQDSGDLANVFASPGDTHQSLPAGGIRSFLHRLQRRECRSVQHPRGHMKDHDRR